MARMDEPRAYLTAKFQIGSCKGPTSFQAAESVFHPDDVPTDRKQNKLDIDKFKRGTVEPGARGDWEQSVFINKVQRRRIRVNSEFDRPNMYAYNLRAEHLPPKNLEHIPKPHKFKVDGMSTARKAELEALRSTDRVLRGYAYSIAEMPVNSKLDDKANWNASSFVEDKLVALRRRTADSSARANTSRRSAQIQGYTAPHHLELQRAPRAAVVDEPFANLARPTGNRESTRPTVKQRTFAHSGVFEFNGAEGAWMWSDTGSRVRDSPGDLVKVTNPNALNFASPTSAA
ncbi:hypothetical protein M885DRAFT_504382 [Pelagophyceae sp. CCMP2097]|nr:hypothetical protein M885DRAFT_504382 [Pelagophyceae sp. CCMP2097]|mmetsp:Transcript_1574/g.5668  ORF Transcript_1574/g.5668 Transcript_1574/m.5668 type:complete len:288 (-) Transcript_1574:69-932(-)